MTTQNPCAPAPILSVVNNTVTALSTDVAQFFGKIHKNVIRDIENLVKLLPSHKKLNFEPLEISRASNLGNGSCIKSKAYRMTRDGFTLLVMGWTGEKALQFKLAWLDAFNAMEKQLYERNVQQSTAADDPITSEQQYEISSHVMRKTHALFGTRNYSAVYRALKRRFRIPRYTCLLQRDYETALKFIDNLAADDFKLPDTAETEPAVQTPHPTYVVQATEFSFSVKANFKQPSDVVPAIPSIPAPTYSITEPELKAIRAMVYYFDNLFVPQIRWAAREALRQNRPDASRFYDVWHEPLWFIGRMKQLIKRNS